MLRQGKLRFIAWIMLLAFSVDVLGRDIAFANAEVLRPSFILPDQNTIASFALSVPMPSLRAISLDPKDPFKIDFVLSQEGVVGTDSQGMKQNFQQEDASRLIKYFLSFLTIPEKDLWVNLSPFENNRIIASDLEKTDAGREMLLQDYVLKQLAASLTNPEHELGKEFWKRVFSRARDKYGITDVPIKDFNKVWVVPARSVVYESNNSAYIGQSRLKVLVEEDYVALNKSKETPAAYQDRQKVGASQVVRELILPELEREVNEGKYFAPLRQMYNSLILAIWFKKRLKAHLINQVYVNQKKTSEIALHEKEMKEKIYAQYLKAVKKGAYNLIREDYDPKQGKLIPRKYFSGGFSFEHADEAMTILPGSLLARTKVSEWGEKGWNHFSVLLTPIGMSKMTLMAMTMGVGMAAVGSINDAQAKPGTQSSIITQDVNSVRSDQERLNFLRSASSTTPEKVVVFFSTEKDKDYIRSNWDVLIKNPTYWVKKAMVMSFQKESGNLLVDGILGPNTRGVIDAKMTNVDTQSGNQAAVDKTTGGFDGVEHLLRSIREGTYKPRLEVSQEGSVDLVHNGVATHTAEPAVYRSVSSSGTLSRTPYEARLNIPMIPYSQEITASAGGIVHGLDTLKTGYNQGDVIFEIINPDLERSIVEDRARLKFLEDDLKVIKDLRHKNALAVSVGDEIAPREAEIADIKVRLAKALEQKKMGQVIAPYQMTIHHFNVANGARVNQGAPLVQYFSPNVVRVNVTVPPSADFINGINNFTLNGQRILSIIKEVPSLSPNGKDIALSFIVSTAHPVPMGENVAVHATFTYGVMSDPRLYGVRGLAPMLAPVDHVKQEIVRVPVAGEVRLLTKEGDVVAPGQPLAVVGNDTLIEEYSLILNKNIPNIDIQLALALANGEVHLTGDKISRLKSERAALMAKLDDLETRIGLKVIRSPQRGIITSINHHRVNFSVSDELLTLETGTVILGDNNQGTILVEKTDPIKPGDPVIVSIGSVRLPATVLAQNLTVQNPMVNVNNLKALEIQVIDREGLLRQGARVQIIRPKDEAERQIIMDVLKAQAGSESAGSAGAPPNPKLPRPLATPLRLIKRGGTPVPALYTSNGVLNFTTLQQLVSNNNQTGAVQFLQYLQAETAKALPTASGLNLNFGAYLDRNGKVVYGGGVSGMLMGLLSGGVSSGNVLGAASPVVLQLFGNLIDVISGKVGVEKARAGKLAEIAYDSFAVEVINQFYLATRTWIQIGALEQKMSQLEQLLAEEARVSAVISQREAVALSVSANRYANQINRQAIAQQLADLHRQRDVLLKDLQFFTGKPIDANQKFTVDVSWGSGFQPISLLEADQMKALLLGSNSPNPLIKKARDELAAGGLSVELEGFKRWPSITTGGVYSSGPVSPLKTISPYSNSALGRGPTATIAEITLPIFNQHDRLTAKIVSYQQQEMQAVLARTQAELVRQLEQAIVNMNALSNSITQEELTYKIAYAAWSSKASVPDLYTSDRFLAEREQLTMSQLRLSDLKRQYREAEAVLMQLGVRRMPEFQTAFQTMVGNAVAGPHFARVADVKPVIIDPDSVRFNHLRPTGPQDILRSGVVDFQGDIGLRVWILSSADTRNSPGQSINYAANSLPVTDVSTAPLSATVSPPVELKGIVSILKGDPNLVTRLNVMKLFLSQYQYNAKQFFAAVKDVLLSSPYDDVQSELFNVIAQRKDPDLPFVISLVDEALKKNNIGVASQGLRAISNIFLVHADILTKISPMDFNENAQNVFLAFLLTEPDNSIAKQRFLDSSYWNIQELSKIYNGLEQYARSHVSDVGIDQVKKLQSLFYNTIYKRIALNSIDDVFRLGGFENPQFALESDLRTAVNIKSNAKASAVFLKTSPRWSESVFLNQKLRQITQDSMDALLLQGASTDITLPLTRLSTVSLDQRNVDYFNSLGLEAQKEYINSLRDIVQLGRILALETPLRSMILDRLMADRQGRLVVADVYSNTMDKELKRLIESRPWLNTLKSDVLGVENAAANKILRKALLDFYNNTQDEQYLNVRLGLFSDIEIRSMDDDPRGDILKKAAVDRLYTQKAIAAYRMEINRRFEFYAGQRKYSDAEQKVLDEVDLMIARMDDPRLLNQYLMGAQVNEQEKKVLRKLVSIRDSFASDFKSSDQKIPVFSSEIWGVFSIFGAGVLSMLGYFGNKKRIKDKKKKMNSLELANLLRHQLVNVSVDDTPDADKEVIRIPDNIYGPISQPLQTWRSKLVSWSQDADNVSSEELFKGMNLILNNAFNVFRTMPYGQELIWSQSSANRLDEYKLGYSHAYLLAVDSLNVLLKVLANRNLNETQRLRLEQDINTLRLLEQYFARFIRFLEHRGNLEMVLGYKFADHEWMERWGIYPIARRVLLYQRMLLQSKINLEKEIPLLLKEGNQLMSGFYENPDEMVNSSKRELVRVIKNSDTFSRRSMSPGDRRSQKLRSFRSRVWGLVPVFLFFSNIPLAIMGLTHIAAVSSLVSLMLLAIPYISFWIPNLKAIVREQDVTMSLFDRRIQESLKEILDPKGINVPVKPEQVTDDKIMALAQEEGRREIAKEFDSNLSPHFDLIVTITENKGDVNDISDYMHHLKGKLIRENALFDVVASDFDGSGNAFLDIKNKVRAKFESGVYGNLNQRKPWEEMRVLFLFHSHEVLDKPSLLDLGITNGYRAAARMKKPGGNVLVYSRDAYYGPVDMLAEDGITLLTTRITRDDLKRAGWVNSEYSKNGDSRVKEILEKLDLRKMEEDDSQEPRGQKTLNFMANNFNLVNRSLKQFLAFNGMMIIGPEASQALDNIAQETAKTQLQGKYRIHMTSDILIPWLLRIRFSAQNIRMRKLEDYIVERRVWPDVFDGDLNDNTLAAKGYNKQRLVEIGKDLEALYEINHDMIDPRLDVMAFVPHPKAEVTKHYGTDNLVVSRHLQDAALVVDTIPVKSPGGLDLSKTGEHIEFHPEGTLSLSDPVPASVLPSLDAFQGFQFKIIQYQPINNPAKLFLSVKAGQSGPWFNREFSNDLNSSISPIALIK